MTTLDCLKRQGLYKEPLRLHLGCGDTKLPGFVNIDYGQDNHNVMTCAADYFSDVMDLSFPSESVCRIETHHMFEHFKKYDALAMLVKWIDWLKVGGQLVLSTPDIVGIAETLVSKHYSYEEKMFAIRHLAGDQSDTWAIHVDHWFPERFECTLVALGFNIDNIDITETRRGKNGCMADVRVVAIKHEHQLIDKQIISAYDILRETMIDPIEQPMHDIWCKNFKGHFDE